MGKSLRAKKTVVGQHNIQYNHKKYTDIFRFRKFEKSNLCNRVVNVNMFSCIFINCSFCDSELLQIIIHDCTFINCDFTNCCFVGSDISLSHFTKCILDNADFENADICDTQFTNCTGKAKYLNNVCPATGSYVAYKKCDLLGFNRMLARDENECIVVLEIPSQAKRSSGTSDKCRASEAIVKDIIPLDDSKPFRFKRFITASSKYDSKFKYKIGHTVSVPDFDENPYETCSTGIHHFLSKEIAVLY